ncbi:indolepyruvate ferredoxin oxidoreductase beta subunit [Dethiosulfatibacter aminovorans DSM 17477]|uniref:Indolepyruvate ferredoxin oxidoreductase beta subunit n=1 Tax=Dethiosulfatibacter aminovorans DSM 17477 TaxID=1121476 RepID=A0A1M6JH41_9FIRM|nr:indolepyruvate oxidoreductase subunit beta [Dethiosulfatibacter aminovorans]SHJ45996.1 indolepyruvate ferredoxin oxidoreductase beta subunit [Dethiosulfatibacter aminovorans DSM 17477]
MNSYNIILSGVGGQGLILTTKIICVAAMKKGYDVKSNDVVGLAQRGGKVWGSVKIGEKIHSPNIRKGKGDILLGMEMLEAMRWVDFLKEDGLVIMNEYRIPPVPVITEKEEYPKDIGSFLGNDRKLITIDAGGKGREIGSVKVANTVLIGILASETDIDKNCWLEAIEENVPDKFLGENFKAFEAGYGII